MINREDIRSVKFTVDKPAEKSTADELSYESSVKVDKTGKEIKEKLKGIILKSLVQKNDLFLKLDNLVQEIGESPTKKLDGYELKGFRQKLTTIPYKYDFPQVYGNQPAPEKQKYNNLLREFIDLSVDSIVLKAVVDNISEEKIYSLNLNLTSKIGF